MIMTQRGVGVGGGGLVGVRLGCNQSEVLPRHSQGDWGMHMSLGLGPRAQHLAQDTAVFRESWNTQQTTNRRLGMHTNKNNTNLVLQTQACMDFVFQDSLKPQYRIGNNHMRHTCMQLVMKGTEVQTLSMAGSRSVHCQQKLDSYDDHAAYAMLCFLFSPVQISQTGATVHLQAACMTIASSLLSTAVIWLYHIVQILLRLKLEYLRRCWSQM